MTQEYRLLEVDWLKNMWRPDSFFKNAKSVTFQTMTIPNHYMWLYKDKTILYMVKLTLRLSCAMNFAIYPHDTQECKLQMESRELNLRGVKFKFTFWNLPFSVSHHRRHGLRMGPRCTASRWRAHRIASIGFGSESYCGLWVPLRPHHHSDWPLAFQAHKFTPPAISLVSKLCLCWNVDWATTCSTPTFRPVWLSSCR